MYKLIRPVCRESRDEQPAADLLKPKWSHFARAKVSSMNIEYIILIIIYESLPET